MPPKGSNPISELRDRVSKLERKVQCIDGIIDRLDTVDSLVREVRPADLGKSVEERINEFRKIAKHLTGHLKF